MECPTWVSNYLPGNKRVPIGSGLDLWRFSIAIRLYSCEVVEGLN
jgi:hypothetical protein